MAYGNYGPDPTLAIDADRIANSIVSVMANRGDIDQGMAQYCLAQYQQNKPAIVNAVVMSSQSTNQPITPNMIQDQVQKFLANVMQSYRVAPLAYPGMGYPQMGGYPPQQPMGYPYGGAPMGYAAGTAYRNPAYHPEMQQQVSYGQPMGGTYGGYPAGGYRAMGGGYQGGNFQGYANPVQTQTEAVSASRYANATPPPQAQPQQQTVTYRQPAQAQAPTPQPTINPNVPIQYVKPTDMSNEEVTTKTFVGNKRLMRVSDGNYMDYLAGEVPGIVLNKADFMKKINPFITNKNFFVQAICKAPKVINASLKEVTVLINKINQIIQGVLPNTAQWDVNATRRVFIQIHVAFMKETGEAAKALQQFFVQEFNDMVACGYLFSEKGAKLKISSLEDVVELFNENTTNNDIKVWQAQPKYYDMLQMLVFRSIIAPIMQQCGYTLMSIGDRDEQRAMAKLFSDQIIEDKTKDTMAISDVFFTFRQWVDDKHIPAEKIAMGKLLHQELGDKTVMLVPRMFTVTNLAPVGLISGDYANPFALKSFREPSNILEFCLLNGFSKANRAGAAVVSSFDLNLDHVQYHLTLGISNDGAMMIGMK